MTSASDHLSSGHSKTLCDLWFLKMCPIIHLAPRLSSELPHMRALGGSSVRSVRFIKTVRRRVSDLHLLDEHGQEKNQSEDSIEYDIY
jgi:hypothetical protein